MGQAQSKYQTFLPSFLLLLLLLTCRVVHDVEEGEVVDFEVDVVAGFEETFAVVDAV